MKIIFVGSYLSKVKGSKSVAEKLQDMLKDEVEITLTSHFGNKLLRILDIFFSVLFFRGRKTVIDVYSGQAFLIAEIAASAARIRGSDITLILRGGKLSEFASGNPGRIGRLFAKADSICTPSLFLREELGRFGYPVHYLPNPVKLDHFRFSREQVAPLSLLWVRAFTEIYNPGLAVKTLYEVKKVFPAATLTMVGPDNGLLNATRKLIQELGLEDSVSITGPVENHKLHRYYQSHAVYLNTTSYESFGVALVEAAACGIPMVSGSVGEIPYIWQGNSITLCPHLHEKPFSEAAIRLLQDPELAARQAHEAAGIAARFNWENVRSGWLAELKRPHKGQLSR